MEKLFNVEVFVFLFDLVQSFFEAFPTFLANIFNFWFGFIKLISNMIFIVIILYFSLTFYAQHHFFSPY
jgi:hypothetical protein